MAGATHTELALADGVVITSVRFRTSPSTLDWTVILNGQIIEANGDVIKLVNVDAATLFTVGQLNTFKATLNTAVSTAATARGILANT